MLNKKSPLISRSLSIILLSSFLISTVQAKMVPTTQLQHQYDKTELLETFAREDVSKRLISLGVDTDSVNERINNLTNEEIASLNESIDDLPAGGSAVGLVVLIFVVLIFTDMIGATNVFNFVNKV